MQQFRSALPDPSRSKHIHSGLMDVPGLLWQQLCGINKAPIVADDSAFNCTGIQASGDFCLIKARPFRTFVPLLWSCRAQLQHHAAPSPVYFGTAVSYHLQHFSKQLHLRYDV